MITDEKRAFKRIKKKLAVKYKFQGPPSHPSTVSYTDDISLGGVYFTSLEKLDIGQVLECRIELPGALKGTKWLARVVRSEKTGHHMVELFGTAVEFIKSFEDSEKKLKSFLEK